MKKVLLLTTFLFAFNSGHAQTDKAWSSVKKQNIKKNVNVERESFPQEFKLMELDLSMLKQSLFTAPDRYSKSKKGIIISLPNTSGGIEQFEVFEASNFADDLQAQFPEIRAYVGVGINDVSARLRMSIDPKGINTMISRANKNTEFMEPYSQDGKVHVIYNSSRLKSKIPFTCSTVDEVLVQDLTNKASSVSRSSDGRMLNFRLAMSVTPEYTSYHHGILALATPKTSALSAINTTMTRVNGVFEKDFSIHMNLVNNMTIIYDGSVADPYGATDANYNSELQSTLTSVVGDANYDVGHLMGRVGNNGNAGCIGCVCNAGKGSGYTTSTVPVGDNFDIDFVAHEIGHQFGANHTFSNSNEGAGVNVEVGSGVTVMGYAGITNQDTHLHSIDIFHAANIAQVQANMAGKTCPTITNLTHGAPVVNAGLDYTIPKSTPFILTGSATDPNGDVMNYTWEQNDDGGGQTNNNSGARANKPIGPNWVNYVPTTTPSRYFPKLSSVIANQATTPGLDVTAEALSSVARTLNFRLTARDNNILGGQTGFDDMVVTVNATAGPFVVNVPNTNVSWPVGSNQTVTWNVAGTTANGVNAAYVDIFLSTDGGNTYPITLAKKVPNDGSETITIPNTVGSTNRIMVKGNNHIFFDISNTNFTIAAPTSTFALSFSGNQNVDACQGSNATFTIPYTALGGFSGTTSFSVTGQPAGSTVVFTPTSINASGNVVMQISNTSGSAVGFYAMVVTGTSGGTTKTVPFYLNLISGNFGTQMLTSPVNLAVGQSTSVNLTWPVNTSATLYDVQVATDIAFMSIISSGTVSTNSYSVSGLAEGVDYFWRVLPKNAGCMGVFSTANKFTTGTSTCGNIYSNNNNLNVPDGLSSSSASYGPTVTKSIVVPGSLTGNINSLTVDLAFTHPYVDDLQIWITHPDGTPVYLWNHNCEDEFSAVNLTYADGNGLIPEGASCTAANANGTFSPNTPLSVLAGKPAAGTWLLHARDYWSPDVGVIGNWSLNFCVATPLNAESFSSITDLSIYPNPNNGTFNIQFTSSTSNEVRVNVYDLRGREIFNKVYQNNGLFNESLKLNNVQAGIYLVTVQDGNSKTTKKISIQ